MRPNAALLVAAGLATGLVGAACSSAGEPHGSPVLIQVLWIASGQSTLIWTPASNPSSPATVPAGAQEIDFVFDRRLDGNRIEDTVSMSGVETTVPKTDPPITAGWPDSATAMSTPPFADQVLYNSEPLYGGTTAYVFLQPSQVGFPSADTVTFSLDKTGLTSAYGDVMTGPDAIAVATGPFSATFKLPSAIDGSISVPASFMLPIAFSNRAGSPAQLAPYIRVEAGGRNLPVSLAPNASDPTIVYVSPASCLGGWPSDVPIEVTVLAGLPDAFGVALATTTSTSFTASGAATPGFDGGCTGSGTDAGATDAGATDAGATDAGTVDARTDARAADAGTADAGTD